MDITITPDFISNEIEKQNYEISLHADDERVAEGFTISQLEFALTGCKILEHYPDDPRGESCLALGFTVDKTPIHVICGKNPSGHLFVVTVYVPTLPKWKDPYTRNQ